MKSLLFSALFLWGTDALGSSALQSCIDANGPLYVKGSAKDCDAALKKRFASVNADRATRSREVVEQEAQYSTKHPDAISDLESLLRFTKFPLEKRRLVYARIALITERDYVDMSDEDHASLKCLKVAEMIDTQRLYEKLGSHGVYNMDNLMSSGPKNCNPFLRQMADAPL